jgi:EAL domain-containing protein (putative c-di-GMP-specific phosphodiesterase class I)
MAMAIELGISVTAEGVETTGQHRCLGELGCHRLQGFLFGKPQPARIAQNLLDRWRVRCKAGLGLLAEPA